MAWGSVKVIGPADRDVYINENYENIAGQTNSNFAAQYGINTFETLDDLSRVDLRVEASIDSNTPHVEATLQAVIPPELTPLTLATDEVGSS